MNVKEIVESRPTLVFVAILAAVTSAVLFLAPDTFVAGLGDLAKYFHAARLLAPITAASTFFYLLGSRERAKPALKPFDPNRIDTANKEELAILLAFAERGARRLRFRPSLALSALCSARLLTVKVQARPRSRYWGEPGSDHAEIEMPEEVFVHVVANRRRLTEQRDTM